MAALTYLSSGGRVEYTPAQAAQQLRVALARTFDPARFRVTTRTSRTSNGLRVQWTDGPTSAQVDEIADHYRGYHPMDVSDYAPLKYHQGPGGTEYRCMVNYIELERTHSLAFAQYVSDGICAHYGQPWLTLHVDPESGEVIIPRDTTPIVVPAQIGVRAALTLGDAVWYALCGTACTAEIRALLDAPAPR